MPHRGRVLLLALGCALSLLLGNGAATANPHNPTADPDAACARCHAAIVASYRATPMAQGSGPAIEALQTGSYTHPASGVHYTVGKRDAAAVMEYRRPATDPRGPLDGSVTLPYFIGSGHRGRTYLYQREGFWYELPINWYSMPGTWEMLPGHNGVTSMPASGLPIDTACLHCHATSIAQPMPQAENRFAGAPFAQGGVGCAACHGDPTAHLDSEGRVPMVDPAKLPAARRDSICLQCHLEGEAVSYLPGKSLSTFRPGQDLADTAVYFVRGRDAGGGGRAVSEGGRAVSQYEALLRSACRRAVGDSLTCTTCHDPHSSPGTEAERVAWFRGKCLSCHSSPAMATHHLEQQNCATCHMPTRSTTDVSHEQVADHDIERLPGRGGQPSPLVAGGDELAPVGNGNAGPREVGLAYAALSARGDKEAAERALPLLLQAEAAGANDALLHAWLGSLEQRAGDARRARTEYVAALNQDVWQPSALANLAVLDAMEGRLDDGMRLLDRLFTANPGQTSAGLNLALLACSTGQPGRAEAVLRRLAIFNPDDPALRRFLATGDYAGQHCTLPAENHVAH